jgi:hypothetical protein
MEESMSALEWSTADLGFAGAGAPGRPHLVVLPGGAGRPSAPAGPVRVTRRGRLALLGVALSIAVAVGFTGMRGAGAAEPLQSVTVGAGQTLSEIAAVELPEMSIGEGVLAIQIANQMSTAQVSAGQQLVIPRS